MTAARAALILSLFPLLACGKVDLSPDAAPTDPGEIFCFAYEDACGFGNSLGGQPYADRAACLAEFEDYNQVQSECVREHAAFAAEGDQATNCAAAEGGAPCDPDSTFCAQYDLICGFGNDRDPDPFTDASDCQARFDAFDDGRQSCVKQHLGFAEDENNPELHCPHVAGAAPCD